VQFLHTGVSAFGGQGGEGWHGLIACGLGDCFGGLKVHEDLIG
jgi:hypothetical protein